MASPLTDAAAGGLRGVLPQGRRLRRHRLGDRDRPDVAVPDRRPRHARVRPHRAADGHGEGLRPRPRREQGAPAVLGPHRPLVQLRRPTSAACRTSSRRSSRTRSARSRRARRSTASRAARWAPTTRSPSARTTRAAARSTPRSATRPRRSTRRLTDAPEGRDQWATGSSDPVYSDCGATVLQELPADEDRLAAEPAGADRLRPAAGRPHPPDRPPRLAAPARPGHGHDHGRSPTSPTRALPLTQRIYSNRRGRALRPGRRRELRHQQVGLPLLLAADGHGRRSCPTGEIVDADDADHEPAEHGGVEDRVGSRTSATSSSRASSSSRTPTARAWT